MYALIFILLSAVSAQNQTGSEATVTTVTRQIMNNRDFIRLKSNTRLLNPTKTTEKNLGACLLSCDLPCVAFNYDPSTMSCLRANCSQIAAQETEDVSWIRSLDRIPANGTEDIQLMRFVIDTTMHCTSLEMYANFSGTATNLIREALSPDGFHYYNPTKAVLCLRVRSMGEPMGRMVRSDILAPRSLEEVQCKDTECLKFLCQTSVGRGYQLSLSDSVPTTTNTVLLGIVASKRCCGATLEVKEFLNGGGDNFYHGDSAPTGFAPTGKSFFIWRSDYYNGH